MLPFGYFESLAVQVTEGWVEDPLDVTCFSFSLGGWGTSAFHPCVSMLAADDFSSGESGESH